MAINGLSTMSDMNQMAYALSRLLGPALVETSTWLNLVYAETCPDDTNKIRFQKSGSLIAEGVSEGAVYVPSDANSDITDTYVEVTASKIVAGSVLTAEQQRFGGANRAIPRFATEQGSAIARKFDTDCKALIDTVTLTATATSVLDTDTLLEAAYKVRNGLLPNGPLVAVVDRKGAFELQKHIANSGSTIYSNQYNHPLFGTPQANNYAGEMLGIGIYQTSGLSTTGGDDQGVVFDPRYFIAAAMGGSVNTEPRWTGHGVASEVAGLSIELTSWIFYGVAVYYDAAACELRSDT